MTQYCPYCSADNPDDAEECIDCGEDLLECAIKRKDLIDNRYEIKHLIKSGAMGCVYKAYDTQLGNIVAIKKMLSESTEDEVKKFAEKQFWDEARLLSELDHNGIPKLRDFFIAADPETGQDAHFMVMSFIEGVDMETYTEKEGVLPLSLEEGLKIFRSVLDILTYLHLRVPPIIYRDIKPANIMYHEGKVYLIDFGIAEEYNSRRKSVPVGTPGYSAPEQYKGFPEPRSDLYSLAALMHYLFTGLDPSDENKVHFTFTTINQNNSTVPDWLDRLIQNMLSIPTVKRPDSARSVLNTINTNTGTRKTYGGRSKSLTTPVKSPDETAQAKPTGAGIKTKPPGITLKKIKHTRGGTADTRSDRDALRIRSSSVLPKPNRVPELTCTKTTRRTAADKLFAAVQRNSLAGLSVAINEKAPLDARDYIGWTPLHKAAALNYTEIANLLIESKADINAQDASEWTPLHRAAGKGHTEMVKLLLRKGADINAVDMLNFTPLHRAAEMNHTEIIKILVKNGANIDAPDNDGWSPLYRAVALGRREAVSLLVELGARIDTRTYSGWTPLHEAISANLKDVTELLVKKGADTNAKSMKGTTPLQLAKQIGSKEILSILT